MSIHAPVRGAAVKIVFVFGLAMGQPECSGAGNVENVATESPSCGRSPDSLTSMPVKFWE
jgi:hypothetical protein